MMEEGPRYYGKYRGTVISNLDTENKGRLQVNVPDVLGYIPSTWAEPCLPLAGPSGPGMGSFFLPPPLTGVWVEFEYGDPSRPIWVGCRWTETSSPPSKALEGTPVSPNIVFQSLGQNFIAITDLPGPMGGIILQSFTGVSVTVNDTGIYLAAGAASLTLSNTTGTVMINNGALTVTP